MGTEGGPRASGFGLRPAIVASMIALGGLASAQPAKITVGIYAPSVEFGTAQAKLAYAQGLASAIEQRTGIKTEAQSYASLAALRKDGVDFAIVEGQCVAVNPGWRVLANAVIGGGTARAWALFSSGGDAMTALAGKKLAYVQTGCNDGGFIDNAMLESEVDPGFFAGRIAEKDLSGAVADVASYRTAQAVFAPVDAGKGLHQVFATGSVPNPAFVAIASRLPAPTVDQVAAAVIGYGAQGAIAGWTRGTREPFAALAGRLARVVKQPILATPEPVRIDARDVLIDPATLRDTALAGLHHHFVRAEPRMQ